MPEGQFDGYSLLRSNNEINVYTWNTHFNINFKITGIFNKINLIVWYMYVGIDYAYNAGAYLRLSLEK